MSSTDRQTDRRTDGQTDKVNPVYPPSNFVGWGYNNFKLIAIIDGWDISYGIALRWLSLDLTGDKSTLVQGDAWCHQATSHHLSQCWSCSRSPYGIARSQTYVREVDLTHGNKIDVYINVCIIFPQGEIRVKFSNWNMACHKWWFAICLTLKHRETHGCVVSTVATDVLVLKHQAISIHNAD